MVQFAQDPINGEAGGRDVTVQRTGGGSGVVTAVLDDTVAGSAKTAPFKSGTVCPLLRYEPEGELKRESLRDLGIRWRRSIGVDFHDANRATAVIAVVDQIKGGKAPVWQMRIGENPQVEVAGATFTVRHGDGAVLCGTVVSPAGAKVVYVDEKKFPMPYVRVDGSPAQKDYRLRAIRISGGGDYFVVMTLHRGKPLRVSSKGAGLGAQVSIAPPGDEGKTRTVSFDGEKIVWSRRDDARRGP